MQLDRRRRDLGLRRAGAAVGAGVVAEVADEGALVGVGVAAAAAVLGVEGVLQLGQGLGGVLDAEVDDTLRGAPAASRPRSAIAGSSALSTKRVRPRARVDGLRPVFGQRLDLAVAVELVAEEVAEHDQRRVELGGDLRQPGLVDLEEALARRAARAAPWRRPRSCSTRPGCGPAGGRRRRARRRSSPPSSSCRWSR